MFTQFRTGVLGNRLFYQIGLLCLLTAFLAASPSLAGKQGESQSTAPLPKGLGELRSLSVSPAMGALSDRIPIEVSPGRRNVQPHLALTFSSMGGQGLAGLGWDLEIGKVERWRGDGVPTVSPEEAYSFSLGGIGGELRHAGGGVYRPRLEMIYREFRRSGNGWEMRDGEGAVHRFGSRPESRSDGQVWMLDQVEDPNGNTITFYWQTVDGILYPSEIRYTGYAPENDPGRNRVLFQYEARPDTRIHYNYLEAGTSSRRLARISVLTGNQLVRRYELAYHQSPVNGQSLLSSITLVGADDTSLILLRTLEYGSRQLGWQAGRVSNLSLPVDLADGEGRETGAKILDVNGDGFADALDNGKSVYLGDGTGKFTKSGSWSNSLTAAVVSFVNDDGVDQGVRLIDVDSDSLPDLFIAQPGRSHVYLNTGNGWTFDADWSANLASIENQALVLIDPKFGQQTTACSAPHCDGPFGAFAGCSPAHCTGGPDDAPNCLPAHCKPGETQNCTPAHCQTNIVFQGPGVEPFALVDSEGDSKGVQLADANGDGRVDILWSMSRREALWWFGGRSPAYVRGVFLNTGSGWTRDDVLTDALTAFDGEFVTDSEIQGYDFLDVNGDGLGDIVLTRADKEREIWLGTDAGWEKNSVYSDSLAASEIYSLDADKRGQGLMPVDFNDDGLLDYLRANGSVFRAYRNTGSGWLEVAGLSAVLQNNGICFNTSDGKSSGTVLADVDGDGISDVVSAKGGTRSILLSGQLRADLLTGSVNPLGETTLISWMSTTSLDNRDAKGIHRLPGAMPVVKSLTRSDGTNLWTTSYDYRGGLFTDRQFRGFAHTTEFLPSGFSWVRKHLQLEGLAGQPEQETGYDERGRLRIRRSSDFEIVSVTPAIRQFRRVQSDEEALDPDGSTHVRTVHGYDERLNIIETSKDPNPAIAGDETTTTFSWARNDERGIWSLPARIRMSDATGKVLSESVMIYDGLPIGQAGRGLPTRTQDMVAQGSYVTKTLAYDQYGNIVRITDRAGGTAVFAYDATGTYRTKATDAEGRSVSSRYDPRFGEVISDTDASGNETVREYDSFGRLARLRLPGDETSPFGTRSWEYSALGTPGSQSFRLRETETPGEPDTLNTVSYFNGMGLIYRVEREGTGNRKVTTLTEYDDAGNAIRVSRPFYPGESPLFSTIERDALHRPVGVFEPDDVPLSVDYSGPTVSVSDRRNTLTSFERNPDGQVTAIRQEVGGKKRTTEYGYDPAGRIISIKDAIGVRTRLAYDALGRRIRLEDANAGVYEYEYDGEGRLTKQTAPDKSATRFTYNRAGDLTAKLYPDGTAQRIFYGAPGAGNAAGRVIRVEDAAGTLEIAYDARGNVSERRRTVLGRTYITGYSYDSMGRLRRTTYPDGFTVFYEYGTGGHLAAARDGSGRVIVEYDDYTAGGQLKSAVFGNGVRSQFGYDELLRMTDIQTGTPAGSVLQQLNYQYDPDGNVLSITDLAFGASQQFEYDEAGRLTAAAGLYGEERYRYDAAGNMLQKGSMVFGMDPAHPHRVICGLEASAIRGNGKGIVDNPGYQACLEALGAPGKGSNNGKPGAAFELAYDERGNVIRKGDLRFEYDYENRLVRAFGKNGKLIEENIYDVAGQRVIQRTQTDTTIFIDGIWEENGTHASRHVLAGNQILASVVTPRATVRLIDAAPEPMLMAKAGWWDVRRGPFGPEAALPLLFGTLLLGAGAVCISRSRRLRTEIAAAGSACRAHPVRAFTALLIMPALLSASTDWAAAGVRADKPNQGLQAEKRYYYHANHLGSVNVVTDDKASVIARRDYKPYGEAVEWEGANGGPREVLITFNGQRYDESTGLYYLNARHYDPETGRFMMADTEVPDPMNPKALNRYAFAGGNPIRYVDPGGHAWYDFLLAGLVILAAIVITAVTFGALAGVGVVLFTLGAGMIAAAVALSQGLSPLSEQFWRAVVTGMVLGAVIGAGLFALPTMLGAGTFIETVVSMALVGAATGAIESSIAHFASGGSADGLLGELLTGIAMGFAIGAVSGGLMGGLTALGKLGSVALKAVNAIKKVTRVVGAFFKAESLVYAGVISAIARTPQSLGSALLQLMLPGLDLGGYSSSPRKETGIPPWAFSGTWPGMASPSSGGGAAALFQTMPLAP